MVNAREDQEVRDVVHNRFEPGAERGCLARVSARDLSVAAVEDHARVVQDPAEQAGAIAASSQTPR